MTNGLTSPKATDRPPGHTPQAARGAPPPSDAFAGMLDAHQARTAIAEGHSESPEHTAPAPVDQAPAQEQQDAPAGDAKDDPTAVEAAVLAAALPMPIETPVAPVATQPTAPTTQMVVAGGAPTPVVQVVTPVQGQVAPAVPVAETAIGAPAVPGAQTAQAAQVATANAALAADPAGATTEQVPAPAAAAPAQVEAPKPAAAASAPGQQTADGSAGQPQPDSKAAQTLAQARAAVAYGRPQQAEPQQAQAQAAQPASQPAPIAPATSAAPAVAPATPVSAATPVPLARAAEAVEHVLRLASSRGVTHARIALRPADLGAVDVHIRSTAEGLVARVVAHSAEAVQTLQHAAGDLRRSLEEQGLNVLNLDIGQAGERSAGRAGSDADGLASGGRDGDPSGSASGDDEHTTETKTLRLPTGVLVDVLA